MTAGPPLAVVVSAVMPYPPVSGGHKRTLRLIEAIARAGAVPLLLTPDAGESGAAELLRARGWIVEIITDAPSGLLARIRQHAARRPSPYLAGIARRLGELARDAAFVQIEHTQNGYYWETTVGAKTVLSLHNVDSQMLASIMRGARGFARLRAANRMLAMRATERRAVSRADVVFAVSARDRRHFERQARRVIEVPNGIDDDFFALSPDLPHNEDVLFFGHLGYPPNAFGVARFLREGWPALAAARPRARFFIAGKGMSDELVRLVSENERVTMLGFVEDLTPVINRSRLVMVPLWHGGGTRLKVLEALAAARPLVSTPQGVEEVGVRDGRHGLIVERAGELADAAARLLGDRGQSLRLAREGRALAERYRWSRVLAPAEDLYREWLRLQ